jgi:hypothetical protein
MINTSTEYICSTLRRGLAARVEFDATNPIHRAVARHFNDTGRWADKLCPFELHWPHLAVPSMCNALLLKYYTDNDSQLNSTVVPI